MAPSRSGCPGMFLGCIVDALLMFFTVLLPIEDIFWILPELAWCNGSYKGLRNSQILSGSIFLWMNLFLLQLHLNLGENSLFCIFWERNSVKGVSGPNSVPLSQGSEILASRRYFNQKINQNDHSRSQAHGCHCISLSVISPTYLPNYLPTYLAT